MGPSSDGAVADGAVDGGDGAALARAIVLAATLDGQTASDLYWISEDGTRQVRLTNTPGAELYPTWSPDRTRVAFVRDFQLFVIDASGENERRIAEHTGRERTINGNVYSTINGPAAWSPDGTQLAYLYPREPFFVNRGNDDNPEIVDESYATMIHLVNADGTNDRAAPMDPDHTINSLAWAGQTLSFSLADDCPDCAGGQRMATMNIDGSGYQELRFDQPDGVPFGPIKNLDWSPDGTRWVYLQEYGVSDYELPMQMFTSTAYTNNDETQLGADPGWNTRWSPDGASIAFIGNDGIHVVGANGENPHRVLAATNVRGIDW